MKKPLDAKNSPKKPKCVLHKNDSEGYCRNCSTFICSKCIFSSPNIHKNHNFFSLDELAMFLRELIDKNNDLLKSKFYETPNLNIKDAKFSIKQNYQKLIDHVNADCDKIIDIVNKRRVYIENIIREQVDSELKNIEKLEMRWKQKVSIIKDINRIQTNLNDEVVYNNINFIIQGIELLKEPIGLNFYKQINDYDINIEIPEIALMFVNENKNKNDDKNENNNNFGNYNGNFNYYNNYINGNNKNSGKNYGRNNNNNEEDENEKIKIKFDDLCDILNNMFVIHEEDYNDFQFRA